MIASRWERADSITTAMQVVTGGANNPLHQGGVLRAWKVAERSTKEGRTTFRLVLRGGAADKTDAWLTQAFDDAFKLRVLDHNEQLALLEES